jgi:hypothetical protein
MTIFQNDERGASLEKHAPHTQTKEHMKNILMMAAVIVIATAGLAGCATSHQHAGKTCDGACCKLGAEACAKCCGTDCAACCKK